ncbi:MAG: gamma-glutamyl-gamma-aminobutyrate hydrolase family protein [Clostridiaceae bacterium]|jgi:putative glutamine amidotransferase|nr:gamma-glutamyl-gamma-aminobutyrate hydrolase family protein [Clostridiaceae bacterium]
MILIGLSASLDKSGDKHWEGLQQSRVNQAYVDSVLGAGGLPLLIPVMDKKEALRTALAACSGLILTGGQDMSPLHYGQEPEKGLGEVSEARDDYDLALYGLAKDMGLPIFGICRGMQVINVAEGGSLYQDLARESTFKLKHLQEAGRDQISHSVTLTPGSRLHDLLGDRIQVNSFHHQAIRDLAGGFRVSATSDDGVIEAMEALDMDKEKILAVQWHPEELTKTRPEMAALFGYFIQLCEKG